MNAITKIFSIQWHLWVVETSIQTIRNITRQPFKSTGKTDRGIKLSLLFIEVTCRQCPIPSFKKLKMGIQSKVIPNLTLHISQAHKSIPIHLWIHKDLGQLLGSSIKWKSREAQIININLEESQSR